MNINLTWIQTKDLDYSLNAHINGFYALIVEILSSEHQIPFSVGLQCVQRY